jgi:hypothetical protein
VLPATNTIVDEYDRIVNIVSEFFTRKKVLAVKNANSICSRRELSK